MIKITKNVTTNWAKKYNLKIVKNCKNDILNSTVGWVFFESGHFVFSKLKKKKITENFH